MSHSRKRLELTGQRFGKLTVLAPAENIRKRTAWLCRCDCGQETVVTTARLRNGLRTSCGCDNDLYGKPPSEIGRASLTYVDGTCVEMIRAGTVRCNNTSGVPGVNWVARKQRWQASICFKGTRHYLGSYKELSEAVQARKRAEEELYLPFLEQFEKSKEKWPSPRAVKFFKTFHLNMQLSPPLCDNMSITQRRVLHAHSAARVKRLRPALRD